MKRIKCNNCGHVMTNVPTSSIIEDNVIALYHKRNFPQVKKRVACQHCDSVDVEQHIEDVDLSSIQLGKFTMASIDERKRILKERSQQHARQHIHPEKKEIDRVENMIK